jgi:hypothetical protein
MRRHRPPGEGPAQARFNQLEVQRLATDVSKALAHSHSRNSHVVQAVTFFSLIRSAAPSVAVAQVLIEAAQRQMFKSSDGFQAAHYLPGQIRVGPHLPWLLIPNPNARQHLEYLFADVEHLPAAFNKADSAAEAKGLCETFRQMSEVVLHDPQPLGSGQAHKLLVRRIYDDIWIPGSLQAYGNAISQKESVAEVPDLEVDEQGNYNIENLNARGTADWSRDEEVAILHRYREAMRDAPADLGDAKIAEIEQKFRG